VPDLNKRVGFLKATIDKVLFTQRLQWALQRISNQFFTLSPVIDSKKAVKSAISSAVKFNGLIKGSRFSLTMPPRL